MTEYGKVCFDANWKFQLADEQAYAEKEYDDSTWRTLNLPHDWSIEGNYDRNHPSGKKGAFLPTGIGWYRKTFTLETLESTCFQFDGVYKDSQIWINGKKAYEFPYGYSSFRFDATEFLNVGENVIAVRVNDEQGPSSRWYNGCGIYRHVWLIEKKQVSLSNEPFVYTTELTADYAIVKVESEAVVDHEILIEIMDQKGHCIFSGLDTSIKIVNPKRWSIEDPYLYQVNLTLKNQQNKVVDTQSLAMGLRTIAFTPDQGFFLNEISTKIQGVCLHHDVGGLGVAVPDVILKERLIQLKEGGINAVRTGHTPFAPEFYDFCDELGLMVMDEMFDGWQEKAPFDYGAEFFAQRGTKDLVDFIKRDRNHPSIIMWGIGNETGDTDIHHLTDICHEVDPTRMVAGGQLLYGTDVVGLNGPSEAPAYLEKLYRDRPDKPVLLTEYPHCYSTRGFYRTQTWWRDYGRPRFDIPDYSEKEVFDDFEPKISKVVCFNSSYDNASCRISNKDAWKRVRDFTHITGMFMWTGFDYLGESFGWPYRSGNYGIIDLCGFEKDNYYFYQSQWSKKPMVHMLPHWNHKGKEGQLIPVVIYTNCESAEVFLNGKSLGKRVMNGALELLYHIPFEAGVLEVVAVHKDGTVVKTKKVTEGIGEKLELSSKTPLDFMVKATDKDGNLCNLEHSQVTFMVTGGGCLVGLENGNPFDLQAHKESSRDLFYGLAKGYVAVSDSNKPTTVTACVALGETYFEETTTCALTVAQMVIGQGQIGVDATIRYSLDGSDPKDGLEYKEPIEISKGCVVRAVAMVDGACISFEHEFFKGMQEQLSEEFDMPRSELLVGTWVSEDETVTFFADGNADIYKGEKKIWEVSWWYEVPIDEFESETGDISNGEINFPFHATGLRLLKDGSLRLKSTSETGDDLIQIFTHKE